MQAAETRCSRDVAPCDGNRELFVSWFRNNVIYTRIYSNGVRRLTFAPPTRRIYGYPVRVALGFSFLCPLAHQIEASYAVRVPCSWETYLQSHRGTSGSHCLQNHFRNIHFIVLYRPSDIEFAHSKEKNRGSFAHSRAAGIIVNRINSTSALIMDLDAKSRARFKAQTERFILGNLISQICRLNWWK